MPVTLSRRITPWMSFQEKLEISTPLTTKHKHFSHAMLKLVCNIYYSTKWGSTWHRVEIVEIRLQYALSHNVHLLSFFCCFFVLIQVHQWETVLILQSLVVLECYAPYAHCRKWYENIDVIVRKVFYSRLVCSSWSQAAISLVEFLK